MNGFRRCIFLPIVLLIITLAGCSKSNDKGSNINPATGKHPTGWAVAGGGAHPVAFLSGPSSCYECHGTDLKGGISAVSCFTDSRSGISCHANGPGGHPAGWNAANSHGLHAKSAANGIDGLVKCQTCHGADFAGGVAKKSCLNTTGCHGATVSSPHPAKPWLSRLGGSTHASTDTSNAVVCASCHAGGANSTRKPSTPAAAGSAPDCFNNTLCHGVEGHPDGWKAAGAHGAAAKGMAGGAGGFRYCTTCHGPDFAGGSAQQTCLNTAGCHGAGIRSPHPGAPWRSATRSHVSTDTSNDSQCAVCHTGGANSSRKPNAGDQTGASGCFNNTLCHGSTGHAVGWKAPEVHGAEAKKAPGGSTGFASCKKCHGATYMDGSAVTCFNNSACHGSGVYAPHAHKPWFSNAAGQPTHITTDVANADVCAACHTAGANSEFGVRADAPPGTAGCFNNTLCHFHTVDSAGTFKNSAVHGPLAKADLVVCQSCHGVKGSSSFDGLTLSDGSKTTACSACHTSAKAHPTDWQGSGNYSHRTAGNTASACGICHKTNAAGTSPLAAAPSCFTTSYSNALGLTRTCHANGPGVAPHSVPYNNHNATARGNFSYCLGCHQVVANAANSKPPGCQNCHLSSPVATPTGCTSCHAKPPVAQNYPNIGGSHAAHAALNITQNSDQTAACNECHKGLGLGTVDHLNRARLRSAAPQANQVVFGTQLASDISITPVYNSPASGQCSNTYCHGITLTGGGSNKAPRWGQSDYLTAAGCVTCHGFPPATARNGAVTHTSSTTCNTCHTHVNSSNNGFINQSLHIDGKVDVTGGAAHAVPYPGARHKESGATPANCSCHNTTLPGTYPATPRGTPPNCRACHVSNLGIGCADCHLSPPNGTTAPNRTFAHTKHLSSTITSTSFSCDDCHTGGGDPSLQHGYGATTVAFGTFAKTGNVTPLYNSPAAGQCANVYCHGATLAGGSNKTPVWNQTLSGCATCHGFPPPTVRNGTVAHTTISACNVCHTHVNVTNDGFTDSSLHINGRVDVTAGAVHAVPYPGSSHKTAGAVVANCSGCHNTTRTGGSYPAVPSGTPPDCRACHKSSLGLGCIDCHGSPPDGTAAPNRAVAHPKHFSTTITSALTCEGCHANGGSLNARHGNGLTLVAFGTLATGGVYNTATGQCTNVYCHGVTLTGGGSNKTPAWGQTLTGCATCHGFPPTTARNGAVPHTSSTACNSCHTHVSSTNDGFNNAALHINGRVDVNAGAAHAVPYPGSSHKTAGATLANCSGCHNTTRTGGTYPATPSGTPPDCRACHTKATPGIGCGSCHSTPPDGTTAPNRAVSHPKHFATTIASALTCDSCHTNGGSLNARHGNGLTLVAFGTLATGGVYNTGTGQCTNVYCHGVTLTGGGSNKTPAWGQTLTGCATCHGFPPTSARNGAVTHSSSTACNSCHTHVNSTNDGFTNAALHIDGKVDSNGGVSHAVPYPGSSHKTAGAVVANCSGCHNTTRTGGSYPAVPSGTPPDCRACHISSLGLGCIDCHASPPNGTTAPNRAVSHPKHFATTIASALTCDSCHTNGGSLNARHGNGLTLVAFGTLATGGVYNTGTGQCTNVYCHGVTLTGGGSNKTPAWGQTLTGCATCHGFPPTTVRNGAATHTTSTACNTCHTHVNATNDGFINAALHINGVVDVNMHVMPYPGGSHKVAGAIVANCSGCHNTTRTGGSYPAVPSGTPPDCRACHISSLGLGCIDCHASPPNGTTAPNRAVSHPKHFSTTIASALTCDSCHTNGGSLNARHGNGLTLVAFGTLATGGVYNTGTGQCTNVYCHGVTLTGGGSNKTPAWGQTLTGCATCHGFPPTSTRNGAGTHTTSATCHLCHTHVNSTDNGFTNAALHIDGKVDVSAGASHAFPYPGASHSVAGATRANCSCHDMTTTGGPYPVPSGVAPLCSACHLSITNFNGATPGCWDCHGSSATNGLPNGTTFPNNNRSHQAHASIAGTACTICHTGGGSGTATHGSSNRVAATQASVKITFSAQAGPSAVWTAATLTCATTYCHGQGVPVWGTPLWSTTDQCGKCHSSTTAGAVTAGTPFYSTSYPTKVTATSDAKVGAHTAHVTAKSSIATALGCADCHGSVTLTGATHMNGSTTFVWSALASKNGTPVYTASNGTCANVYCHGVTLTGGGSNKIPSWGQTLTGCATCHGFPPASYTRNGVVTLHSSSTSCNTCHSHVNATNNGFTTPALHIDGIVQASASHAVPNYNHQSAGTGAACTGCHAIGTAASVYPAAVLGNAPDCRGCHKKAAPGVGCGSCHGDATGRPNGTLFPDKVGRHQGSGDSAHLGAACTKCHILAGTPPASGSGTGATSNHGPGNQGTNPNLVGPGFITGITITGATKGVSPSASCNHTTINANNGGGCSGGGSKTW